MMILTWVRRSSESIQAERMDGEVEFYESDQPSGHATGVQVNRLLANGHFIDYRMVEEFKGQVRVFTVYQLGLVKPIPYPLVKIVITKRPVGGQ